MRIVTIITTWLLLAVGCGSPEVPTQSDDTLEASSEQAVSPPAEVISTAAPLCEEQEVVCPAGEKGDKGEPGEAGEKGDPGEDGDDAEPCTVTATATGVRISCSKDTGQEVRNGTNGTNGVNGNNGQDGEDGAKGEKGEKGEPGSPNLMFYTTTFTHTHQIGDGEDVSASAWCDEGDQAIGGGCTYGTGPTPDLKAFSTTSDATGVTGWSCLWEGDSVATWLVTTTVTCIDM